MTYPNRLCLHLLSDHFGFTNHRWKENKEDRQIPYQTYAQIEAVVLLYHLEVNENYYLVILNSHIYNWIQNRLDKSR